MNQRAKLSTWGLSWCLSRSITYSTPAESGFFARSGGGQQLLPEPYHYGHAQSRDIHTFMFNRRACTSKRGRPSATAEAEAAGITSLKHETGQSSKQVGKLHRLSRMIAPSLSEFSGFLRLDCQAYTKRNIIESCERMPDKGARRHAYGMKDEAPNLCRYSSIHDHSTQSPHSSARPYFQA